MPFTVDPKLIENDEVRLTENSSGNLEIIHVPTNSTLEIDESATLSNVGGGFVEIVKVTADHTATSQQAVLADASSGPITVTLPTPSPRDQVGVKKIDSSTNAVTITTPGSETIDGQSSISITNQFTSREVLTAGTDYFII